MESRVNRKAGSLSPRNGLATIEFALIAPVFLLLMAGALDYAMSIRTAACLADSARSAAQYGSLSVANSADTAGMASAAKNTSPGITGMSVTATRTCQCSGGVAVNCTGSCNADKMIVYVQVVTQATAHTVFEYAQLPFPSLVKGRATMRAQ